MAKRHCWEEDAACAALERSKAEMQEAAETMRQGGAQESESMISHFGFQGSVRMLNWVQDSECQESGLRCCSTHCVGSVLGWIPSAFCHQVPRVRHARGVGSRR